jgi:putative hydrolase of the HAD superfamily
MSDSSWTEAVVRNQRPMVPTPTDVQPQLARIPGVRAVIFDVYGTLLISGSGDVGSADETDHEEFIGAAIKAAGGPTGTASIPTSDQLHTQIRLTNQSNQSESCPKPEVDIVAVWRAVVRQSGISEFADDTAGIVRLAAEYESRANPTWPMPGARTVLARLAEQDPALGIVSNAQVFTITLVEDLLGKPLAAAGFDLDLCVFSNRFRQAKPGPRLFDCLREGLARRGMGPNEAIYVGNDMLNDVWAASQAGLKTAWFAGDGRSCRPREDDPRCRSLRPDLVITDLLQLLDCLDIE